MPRRMIDSAIWRNEKVNNLPDAGRLLFIGIFSNADDDGRLKASPRFLKATIFPYDDDKTADQIRELRDQCAESGLIRVYSNNGKEYLDIPGWEEHQKIRKDRYTPSKLPGYNEADNHLTTKCQPMGNHLTTAGRHSIGEGRVGEVRGGEGSTPLSLDKSKDLSKSKGARNKRADPVVNEIFSEMRRFLGYPEAIRGEGNSSAAASGRLKETKKAIDPIPNYGKEGKAIKRMLARGFTREAIVECWESKVSQRGGEFVSMTWVNEDIGKPAKQRRSTEPSSEEEITKSIKEAGI